eukprot:3109615-Ditylum_brightwellii.AAC.1
MSTLSHDTLKSGNGKQSTEGLQKGNKNMCTKDNNSKEDGIISNNKEGNNKEQPMDLDKIIMTSTKRAKRLAKEHMLT